MPVAMLRHERQQFAIYGLMQIAIASRALVVGGWSDEAPRAAFAFDAQGRLVEARDEVADPAGGTGKIAQVFRFSNHRDVDGMAWPTRIEILQDGQPYMSLDLDKVEAGILPTIMPTCTPGRPSPAP